MNRNTLNRINKYLELELKLSPEAVGVVFNESTIRTEDVTYTKEDARVALADNQGIEGYNIYLGDLFECIESNSAVTKALYERMLVHTAHNDIEGFLNESN